MTGSLCAFGGKSERHLRDSVSSEDVEDSSVEDTGVEVDLGVPAVKGELPIAVHEILLGVVVLLSDLLPVVLGEEGIEALVDCLEVGVGFRAGGHRLAELSPRGV